MVQMYLFLTYILLELLQQKYIRAIWNIQSRAHSLVLRTFHCLQYFCLLFPFSLRLNLFRLSIQKLRNDHREMQNAFYNIKKAPVRTRPELFSRGLFEFSMLPNTSCSGENQGQGFSSLYNPLIEPNLEGFLPELSLSSSNDRLISPLDLFSSLLLFVFILQTFFSYSTVFLVSPSCIKVHPFI